MPVTHMNRNLWRYDNHAFYLSKINSTFMTSIFIA